MGSFKNALFEFENYSLKIYLFFMASYGLSRTVPYDIKYSYCDTICMALCN